MRIVQHPIDRDYFNRAHRTVDLLFSGKWQVDILCSMRHGPIRIGQLGRLMPGVSKKVLAQGLRRLEANGIVIRTDLSETTLHVEYDLRPEVRTRVDDLLDELSAWEVSSH